MEKSKKKLSDYEVEMWIRGLIISHNRGDKEKEKQIMKRFYDADILILAAYAEPSEESPMVNVDWRRVGEPWEKNKTVTYYSPTRH